MPWGFVYGVWWTDHFCFKIGRQILVSISGTCLVYSPQAEGHFGGVIQTSVGISVFRVLFGLSCGRECQVL